MKKHTRRQNKATHSRATGIEHVEKIIRGAEHDIQAAQEKWSCPYAAAEYIVGLEKKLRYIHKACADLYDLVSSDSAVAKLMKLRVRHDEKELAHADAHRHRRGSVSFYKPEP